MKQFSEKEIKDIAYNCKRATYLIEKQQTAKISSREKLELKVHLAGCSICVKFMQQSAIINQLARKILLSAPPEQKLDKEFKMHLQVRISNELGHG